MFAYGQSGSGKTHTMLGDLPGQADGALPEQAGLVPRMFVRLFERIRAAEAEPREGRALTFLCRVSCLEIHQEVLTDLLAPERPRLQVRRRAPGPDAGQLPAPGWDDATSLQCCAALQAARRAARESLQADCRVMHNDLFAPV